MKSFAVLALAGAAAAQGVSSLGSCAQLCINNMAQIANQQFSCSAGDVNCFCTKSNWAYGVRDCSQQACSGTESAQAIAWAASQCVGGAGQNGQSAAASGTAAAVPILSSALATVTGAAASAAASVTGAAGSAAGSAASAASSAASGAAASASSAASGALASASSAASGALASASSAAGSAASSASGALNSAASTLASAASSAASRASSATAAASSAVNSAGAAPKMTGIPVVAGAGLAALFLL